MNALTGPYTMPATSPKLQIKPLLTVLVILGGIIAVLAAAGGFVIYISKSEIGSALENPLARLAAVEANTKTIPTLELSLRETEKTVVELKTTVTLYLAQQPLDKKTAESVTGGAVVKALSTKNPLERRAALSVASEVLERATSHHVVLDYKKINHYGSTLLDQPVEKEELSDLKLALSRLAHQRTLSAPERTAPSDSQIISNKEQRLDGESLANVTFVNCKILYDNGWLNLENVRFINCTFEVDLEGGKGFYAALFKSEESIPKLTVKSLGPGPKKTGGS